MLRVGLTGGIGSGKSTVAHRLEELGAVLADADVLAREVVRPGEPALAEIAERFGPEVIAADGSLDRPALGAIVFADEQARRDLEAITHPRIAERTAQIAATVAPGGVLVHDVPLLVEGRMGARYHLVLVVGVDAETRVRRLVEHRGMAEADARSRIAAQASDEERRAVADVWLDNTGTKGETLAAVDRLWTERLAPFAANLAAQRRVERPEALRLVGPDPAWAPTAERLLGRLRHALGERVVTADHIGSTAVPMLAKDVIDLQVGVRTLEDADDPGFVAALAEAGYPRVAAVDRDNAKDGTPWPKRFHGGSDPGQVVHVHVREVGSPGWRWALLCRDWLRAEPSARAAYLHLKERLRDAGLDAGAYGAGKEPWFDAVQVQVEAWAARTGWAPRP